MQIVHHLSNDLASFTREFTDILNIVRTRSKFVYVCGDYYIDLLKVNSNNDYCLFYENVLSSSFAKKITLPTRICRLLNLYLVILWILDFKYILLLSLCDTTSTFIDNVYTNVIEKEHTSGILVRPISDHQMYFCMINKNYIKPKTKQKYVEIEVCNQESLEKFKLR